MRYLVVILVCAFTFLKADFNQEATGSKFLKNGISWVKECQGDKIYLKTEKLIISDNNIIVIDEQNGDFFLPELYFDETGIYTRISSLKESSSATVYPMVYCNTCGEWTVINWRGNCVKCGKNPESGN